MRFEHQMDVRSLAATNINFMTLLHLILNREQMLLFWHQQERVVTQYESEEKEKRINDEEEFNNSLLKFNLASPLTDINLEKAFKELEGFKIDSELSRKLLLGVFDFKDSKTYPSPKPY